MAPPHPTITAPALQNAAACEASYTQPIAIGPSSRPRAPRACAAPSIAPCSVGFAKRDTSPEAAGLNKPVANASSTVHAYKATVVWILGTTAIPERHAERTGHNEQCPLAHAVRAELPEEIALDERERGADGGEQPRELLLVPAEAHLRPQGQGDCVAREGKGLDAPGRHQGPEPWDARRAAPIWEKSQSGRDVRCSSRSDSGRMKYAETKFASESAAATSPGRVGSERWAASSPIDRADNEPEPEPSADHAHAPGPLGGRGDVGDVGLSRSDIAARESRDHAGDEPDGVGMSRREEDVTQRIAEHRD